jgi:iron complex outermembrane recepter protein
LGQPIVLQAYNAPGSASPTDLLYDDNYKSKVLAGFGQLAFDLPGNVELALALRYDREKREISNNVPRAIAPFLQTCSLAPNCYINPYYNTNPTATSIPDREKTYSQLQPKLTVNWKATEQFSAYASYGYGFRSGGFNSLGSAATIQSFYVANGLQTVQNVQDDYKKEVAKAAEIGFKSNFFDRRVSLNAAIFHTKVDNMQFFEFFAGPFGLLRVVTNIDKVTLKGAELDAKFRATDSLTLSLGAAVTKGNIDANTNRPYTVGNEVPYAPKATGNAGIELKLPLASSGWTWLTRLDAVYTGKTWFHTVQNNTVAPTLFTPFAAFFGLPGDAFDGNFGNTQRDAFTLLNARIGFSNDTMSITAFGRNLSDKHYLAEVIPAPEFGGSFIHDGQGRSYGVAVTYAFK